MRLNPWSTSATPGATAEVLAEVERALTAHELIKIRIGGLDRDGRVALGHQLALAADATVVHRVGKVLILWRPRPLSEP